MNYRKRMLWLACLIVPAVTAGIGRECHAGYIASNLGAGNSFGQNSYNLTGPKASTGLGYGLAVEFSISGSSPVAFGSAQLALAFHNGTTNAVDVLLMTDQSGIPGTALETIHLSGLSANASLVTANSTVHSLLIPGANYWLAAVASNDTFMSWSVNSLSESGHLAFRTDSGQGPGAWGTSPGNLDPAYAITAASVPAPPSFALLGVGAITLTGYRIGRRPRFAHRGND